jgi:rubrerythrin
MNRTGMQMSPLDAKALLSGTDETVPTSPGDTSAMTAMRQSYAREADALGTVPVPGTMKGAFKTGLQMLTGNRPQLLIDKLAERAAFERAGTRLYDALLAKCELRAEEIGPQHYARLVEIRDEEVRHFGLVTEAIVRLGADPTAQTPCADLVGMEGIGLLQAVAEPRTTVVQSLHAVLVAELADNAGWELLIKLADECGQEEIARSFEPALAAEQAHLAEVKQLVERLTLGASRMGSEAAKLS